MKLHEPWILDQIGTTADEVAATLKENGIHGVRNTVRFLNPIVRYVQDELGDHTLLIDVMSGTTARVVHRNGSQEQIGLPQAVKEFLERFNQGKYPDLEENL